MTGQAVLDRTDQIGRRLASRVPVGLPARFVTTDDSFRVELEDLSETGARIRLPWPRRQSSGELLWLSYRAFAEVAWQRESLCGLVFHQEIENALLIQTAEIAKLALKEPLGSAARLAGAWVYGPGDW